MANLSTSTQQNITLQTPSTSPLTGGEPSRSSPDKGRLGGVCSGYRNMFLFDDEK
jgi:hypothetical protein